MKGLSEIWSKMIALRKAGNQDYMLILINDREGVSYETTLSKGLAINERWVAHELKKAGKNGGYAVVPIADDSISNAAELGTYLLNNGKGYKVTYAEWVGDHAQIKSRQFGFQYLVGLATVGYENSEKVTICYVTDTQGHVMYIYGEGGKDVLSILPQGTYRQLVDQQQKTADSLPLGFAYSDEQLQELLQKWDCKEEDLVRISTLGSTLCRKSDKEHVVEVLNSLPKELESKLYSNWFFARDAFRYELGNHEFCITHDCEEAVEALGLTVEEAHVSMYLHTALYSAINLYLKEAV